MSEEKASEQPDARSFEERVFARFDALEERMTAFEGRMTGFEDRMIALDENVDRRLQETRPIWAAVLAQLEQLNNKFGLVATDIYDLRAKVAALDQRTTSLESSRAQ